MKTAIVYASRRGAARKIARQIQAQIPQSRLCEIGRDNLPLLSEYDRIILGGSLMAGQLSGELKRFIKRNQCELRQKELGLFLSGMDCSQTQQYFDHNFPAEIVTHARARAFLGGIFDPAQCGFLARLIMKQAAGISAYTATIDPGEIDAFVQKMHA